MVENPETKSWGHYQGLRGVTNKSGKNLMVSVADKYQYMEDLRRLDACRPKEWQRTVYVWMMGVIIPLKWKMWKRALARHPDHQFRDYITSGI